MKLFKKFIFFCIYASGLSALYARMTPQRARILCYHRIAEAPNDPLLDVSAPAFAQQLAYLKKRYAPVPLHNIVMRLRDRKPFHDRSVALTFDDGSADWVRYVLPLLSQYQIPATFFVCTGYLNKPFIPYPNNHRPARALTTHELKVMSAHLWVSIGGHTEQHPHLSLLTKDEAYLEALNSKINLEKLLGKKVDYFAYPFGDAPDYTNETKQAVERAGYIGACSLIERNVTVRDVDPYDIPRVVIFDEPLWMFKVRVSGIIDDFAFLLSKIKRAMIHAKSSPASLPRAPHIHRSQAYPHTNPKVSVIIAAYNVGQFLEGALQSVRTQTFQDWEAFILDDASHDVTEMIARRYTDLDPRFVYVKNQQRIGFQRNIIQGIRISRGKYIAPLDGDDEWCDKEKLSEQVSILDQNPDVVLMAGGFTAVDATNHHTLSNYPDPWYDEKTIRARLLIENIIPHGSACYRREAYMAAGGYDPGCTVTEDYDLWLRLALMGALRKVKKVYLRHHIHNKNISILKRRQQVWEGIKLVMKYRRHYPHAFLALLNRIILLIACFVPQSVRRTITRLSAFQKYRAALIQNLTKS